MSRDALVAALKRRTGDDTQSLSEAFGIAHPRVPAGWTEADVAHVAAFYGALGPHTPRDRMTCACAWCGTWRLLGGPEDAALAEVERLFGPKGRELVEPLTGEELVALVGELEGRG